MEGQVGPYRPRTTAEARALMAIAEHNSRVRQAQIDEYKRRGEIRALPPTLRQRLQRVVRGFNVKPYPEQNAANAKASGKQFSTRTGNETGQTSRTPFDVRDDIESAARTVKRDVQTVGEARRKNAQDAKRKVANAGKKVKENAKALGKGLAWSVQKGVEQAQEHYEAARTALGQNEAVNNILYGAKGVPISREIVEGAKAVGGGVGDIGGAVADSWRGPINAAKDAGKWTANNVQFKPGTPTVAGPGQMPMTLQETGAAIRPVVNGAKDFANDVAQSAKSLYGHTWELIKDPNQAGRELGEAIGTGIRTAAPYVKDTAVGLGTGLKNVATIPYDVGAGLSEGLGFDEKAADTVLSWFGKDRKSVAEQKQREFEDRRRYNAMLQRQAEREENVRLQNEQMKQQAEERRLRIGEMQQRFDENKRKSEALQRQHDEQGRQYAERAEQHKNRMKELALDRRDMEADRRARNELRFAERGLSAQDIRSRMADIQRAYGKEISNDQWQSALGVDPNGDVYGLRLADRKQLMSRLDDLSGRVDRYNQGQARQKRIQDARAYQRQIMEQRGHWSNGGFQSANRPIFTPNGMTAAQVDFSNRLKAQRMAREMSPTTRGQRAAYGQMVNNGMLTEMNIASFQGMGMQGPRLNRAIGATTGGQAYLDMRDAIAVLRDYMMKEAEMRGRRSAASMGALGANALSGGNPNNPGTQAAVDNVVNGTPPPTPVQTAPQATATPQGHPPTGFKVNAPLEDGGIVNQAQEAMTNFRENAGLPQREAMPDDVKKQYGF